MNYYCIKNESSFTKGKIYRTMHSVIAGKQVLVSDNPNYRIGLTYKPKSFILVKYSVPLLWGRLKLVFL